MTATVQTFNYSVDLLQAILWHYNDASNIIGLLEQKQTFYSTAQQTFWEDWTRDVFDLRTANEFGLSVWSNILDIPFFSSTEISPTDYQAWGFDTGDDTAPITNFNNGNFATSLSGFINLDVSQRRLLLRLRYFQLTTTATVPEINEFARTLLGNQDVYVLDGNNMTITYVFRTVPPSNLLLVAQQFDILPRPSGVSVNIAITPLVKWGFGSDRRNFLSGNFFGSEI